MSYDVRLEMPNGETARVASHQAGGTIALGGSTLTTTTITYNFSYFYYNEIDEEEGFRWLHNKKARETTQVLARAVRKLGTEPHGDVDSYWIPCPGNAGSDLETLLYWALDNPEATWKVT